MAWRWLIQRVIDTDYSFNFLFHLCRAFYFERKKLVAIFKQTNTHKFAIEINVDIIKVHSHLFYFIFLINLSPFSPLSTIRIYVQSLKIQLHIDSHQILLALWQFYPIHTYIHAVTCRGLVMLRANFLIVCPKDSSRDAYLGLVLRNGKKEDILNMYKTDEIKTFFFT